MIPFDPTGFFRSVLMSAGFAYPVRYACSFGLATLIYLIVSSLSYDYPSVSVIKVTSENPKLFIFSLATLVAFWPSLLSKNLRPDRMGGHIDTFSDVIDKSGLTDVQKRLLWRRLADKIIDQTVVGNPLDDKRMRDLAEQSVAETSDEGAKDPLLPS